MQPLGISRCCGSAMTAAVPHNCARAGCTELLGLIHLGKRLDTNASRIVLMVMETAADGTLYALGRQETAEEPNNTNNQHARQAIPIPQLP